VVPSGTKCHLGVPAPIGACHTTLACSVDRKLVLFLLQVAVKVGMLVGHVRGLGYPCYIS